ncbi:MAG TPA: hypothetical protein VF481_01485, partial [Novosphingobium sp.]
MRSLLLFPLVAAASPVFAQEASPSPEAAAPAKDESADGATVDAGTGTAISADGKEILVVATRIKGQVEAPQAPILVLDEADIASYGADSLTDLLDQLSPQ